MTSNAAAINARRCLGLIVVFLTACGRSDSPPAAVRTDSAGIEIITSAADERTVWSVVDTAELLIGGRGDALEPVMYSPGSVARWRDGYAVSDYMLRAIMLFDSDGKLIQRMGRRGGGPGEYGLLSDLIDRGDSLIAIDRAQLRMTVYRDTTLVATHTLPQGWRTTELAGVLPDGRFVIAMDEYGGPRVLGARRLRYIVAILDSREEPATADTLGVFEGAEVFTSPQGRNGSLTMDRPLARSTVAKVWRDWIVVGNSDTYELRFYDADGQLARIVRLLNAQRTLTPQIRERAEQSYLEGARLRSQSPIGGQDVAAERALDELPWPDMLPAFADIRTDAEGYLWVQRYKLESADRAVWDVFGADGAHMGSVQLPPGTTLVHIDSAAVILQSYDEDDAATLARHRLER